MAFALLFVLLAMVTVATLQLVTVHRRRMPPVERPQQHRRPRGDRPHDGWMT